MERKARTNPAQLHGLEGKKTSGRRRDFFLDLPFYRTYQELGLSAIQSIGFVQNCQTHLDQRNLVRATAFHVKKKSAAMAPM
jgi:hypothetical protein